MKSALVLASLLVLSTAPAFAQEIPEDLVGDEHVREELGVNRFTTPSIKALFEDLDDLGTLPYDKLKRELPKGVARDRSMVALCLGTLISEGFLIVQSEKVSELETVGRCILKQAKVLGAGMRVTKHTKSILENSALGEWDTLKNELAKTQKDVEDEMVLLRDIDIAHLVSLGGWLRAFEIAAVTASDPYSEKKAKKLSRNELVAYFIQTLEGLEPNLSSRPHIISMRDGLEGILADLGGFDQEAEAEGTAVEPTVPNAEQTVVLAKKARALIEIIEAGK